MDAEALLRDLRAHADVASLFGLAFGPALARHVQTLLRAEGERAARRAAVFMAQKVLGGEIAMVDDAVAHATAEKPECNAGHAPEEDDA